MSQNPYDLSNLRELVTPRPQPVGVTVAAPLSDAQLLAMMASNLAVDGPMSPTNAVELAIEIVAEAVAQLEAGRLDACLAKARKRLDG